MSPSEWMSLSSHAAKNQTEIIFRLVFVIKSDLQSALMALSIISMHF